MYFRMCLLLLFLSFFSSSSLLFCSSQFSLSNFLPAVSQCHHHSATGVRRLLSSFPIRRFPHVYSGSQLLAAISSQSNQNQIKLTQCADLQSIDKFFAFAFPFHQCEPAVAAPVHCRTVKVKIQYCCTVFSTHT